MDNQHKTRFKGDGIIIFSDIPMSIKAEKALKNMGFNARLIAPPPKLRMGCEMGVAITLVQKQDIERLFAEEDIQYSQILPLNPD
jgi:hypothetical protein